MASIDGGVNDVPHFLFNFLSTLKSLMVFFSPVCENFRRDGEVISTFFQDEKCTITFKVVLAGDDM